MSRACQRCGFVPEQKPTGWIIEGTWSGYKSSQSRIVHREYTKSKARAEGVAKLGAIYYTDGTALYLRVAVHRGRKAAPPIAGYSGLIDDCLRHGVNRVDALQEAKDAARAATIVPPEDRQPIGPEPGLSHRDIDL